MINKQRKLPQEIIDITSLTLYGDKNAAQGSVAVIVWTPSWTIPVGYRLSLMHVPLVKDRKKRLSVCPAIVWPVQSGGQRLRSLQNNVAAHRAKYVFVISPVVKENCVEEDGCNCDSFSIADGYNEASGGEKTAHRG